MRRLVCSLIVSVLLFSKVALCATISSPFISYDTKKTVTLVGEINDGMAASVSVQMAMSLDIPGPRLVIIQSPGGEVNAGAKIIKLLQAEKEHTHEKLVCVVLGTAHSMAFNLLSRCDVRLATSGSEMVVHKIAYYGTDPNVRLTAKKLKEMAARLESIDAAFDEVNRKAMGLSASEFDRYADAERRWTAKELLAMHYLDGIVTFSP